MKVTYHPPEDQGKFYVDESGDVYYMIQFVNHGGDARSWEMLNLETGDFVFAGSTPSQEETFIGDYIRLKPGSKVTIVV